MNIDDIRQTMNDGNPGEAIMRATKVLAGDPANREAARLLSYLLAHVQLMDPSGMEPAGLTAAFSFDEIDPQPLAMAAVDYLKNCTDLFDAIRLCATEGREQGAKWLLSSKGRNILRNPLLGAVLTNATNTDLGLEALLMATRRAILLSNPKDTLRKGPVMDFAITLIKQVEINEYILAVSPEEKAKLAEIYINGAALAKGSKGPIESLVLKALYQPLHELLPADFNATAIKPKALSDHIARHLTERREEKALAATIKSLGDIGDKTSKDVATLYEENPYPRWVSLYKPEAGVRKKQIGAFFKEADLAFMDKPYRVLIAGCGTGQQAVEAGLAYGPQAALTAIDISRASIAYALRKTKQYGAHNIDFYQCDILNADLLDGTFDVIESVGVLHHMKDPWAGWRALVQKLKPGGLMKIALYSKAARATIAELRNEIAASGLGDDAASIRSYRQKIIGEGQAGKGSFLVESDDFYTLSNFRDLMFHVSEQHMTIPGIAAFLKDNGLTFKGFHVPNEIAPGYPEGDNATDLDKWHTFEEANPDTFKGMYVFWCQKS